MSTLQKLFSWQVEDWLEHIYPARFALEQSSVGTPRVVVGVPAGDSAVFKQLVGCLEPPYFLLYVLHTPRGEGPAGRYQSPEVTREEFHAFVARFGDYLAADARFDLWAHSPQEQATIVWDRHNEIFAYGPLERFAAELRTLGFTLGSVEVPVPHAHQYRAEFDPQAAATLQAFPWAYTPLRPEDEQ